jgi:Rps23 Pro-64 3,4-dihydroxylase Tpa1-like proline 4-hydroxylase
MPTILAFLMVLVTGASVSAESDRVQDRLAQLVRDERDRQDCMWRETLARPRPENSEKLREIAAVVAYLCSQKIRERMLQDSKPATDLPQREGVAFDQLDAQKRALLIGQQIKELDQKNRPKAPD